MKKFLLSILALALLACQSTTKPDQENEQSQTFGSITLPEGFTATVFADELGRGRHLALGQNGDAYLRLREDHKGHSLVALRDTNNDGSADLKEYFGPATGGTGVRLQGGYLYYSTDTQVFRKKFIGDELVPSGEPELLLTLPEQDQHAAKPLAFDGQGNMYVTIGAPSNTCQDPDRTEGVPGQDPCPLLKTSGGIWKFSASTPDQKFEDGQRYATGIRNAVAITWNQADDHLYAVQHGRDQLHDHWPEKFTQKESAELPAEEFFRIREGDDFGWPYCFYDWRKDKKVLNPEYGGDGDTVGRCGAYRQSIVAFPGHWAPNAVAFYQGDQFPVRYKGGAFIAFHGSWNRAPFPQQGYKVVFVPFSGNQPMSGFDTFADQFAGEGGDFISPSDAEFRPCGLAMGPDGSLYISDSVEGRIWKVQYREGSQKE